MTTISTTVSLVSFSGPIFNQQTQGSCKANQICGALALMANEYGVEIAPLARQQLYNDTRELMGTFTKDSGSVAKYAEQVAMKGIANESSFAYGMNNLYVKPSAEVYENAALQKVQSFTHVAIEGNVSYVSNWIGSMLMQGKPVLVDSYIHYGFGVDINSFQNPINGGHAYLVVGADYTARTYTVQNSWGAGWASGGYGTIKFSDLPGIGPTSGGMGGAYQDLLGLSVINGFAGVDYEWTATRKDIAALFVGILGRAVEHEAVTFYESAMHHGVTDVQEANMLINSAEGQSLYGKMSNVTFAAAIYSSVLGRGIDPGGLVFWTNALDGGMTRGAVADMMIDTVRGHYDRVESYDRLENMTTVAMNYALTYQIDGSHGAVASRALHGVTSDANTVQVALVGIHEAVYYVA